MIDRFARTGLLVRIALLSACGMQDAAEVGAPPDPDADSYAVTQSALSGLTPQLTAVAPGLGPDVGGIAVTLQGRNFRPGASVSFGDAVAYPVTVVSSTQLSVTLPSKLGAFGRTPVTVTMPDGKSVARSDLFSYYSDSLAFNAPAHLPLHNRTDSVVAGDLNGDGKNDVVVCAEEITSISVYLGNGDGALQAPRSYSIGSTPSGVLLLDANGDGKLDIFVTTPEANTVSVLLGNGDGTFKAVQSSPSISGAWLDAFGDFNRDGKADVAVSNGTSDSIAVLIGKGDGTFKTPVTYPTGGGVSKASAWDCASADMNGDGKPDLVATLPNDGRVSVLLGNGDGTFQAAKLSSTGGFGVSVYGLAIGDFNGDLKPDVVARTPSLFSGSMILWLGGGDGNLSDEQDFGWSVSADQVRSIDLNGDGKLDIVSKLHPSGFAISLGKGDGTFTDSSPWTGIGGDAYTFADLDGDSRFELITTDYLKSDLAIAFGNSTGTGFAQPTVIPVGGKPSAVVLGDWNGDGKRDLAVARFDANSIVALLGNGMNNFRAPTTSAVSKGPNAAAAGDWNGDGKSDILTACVDSANVNLLLSKGDGSFQATKTFATGNSPTAVVAADLNADGKLDAVTANYDADNVTVLLGSGSGSFTAKSYAAGKYPSAVVVGDWNGDGKPDLAVANADPGTVSILLATTSGFGTAKSFPTGKNPISIVAGDWNGDGKLDLATSNSDSNNIAILLGTGSGTFSAATFLATDAFPNVLVSADLNSDGKADLAVSCDGSQTVQLLLGFGDGTFFPSKRTLTRSSIGTLSVGDMNGDGKPDLFLASERDGTVNVLANATP